MTTYVCKVHKVSLKVEGRKRTFSPGDWSKGFPACAILTAREEELRKGKMGECIIEWS